MPVIAPAHLRRQGHEDGLGAPPGLEAEEGAAVVDQVEFHVAAPAVFLEGPFPLAPGQPLAPLDDRQVSGQIVVTDAFQEVETAGEAPRVQVVEEEATDTPGLLAMAEKEILIALALEARIDLRAEGQAGGAGDPMPVHRILHKAVVGRQVEAAAEPPDRCRVRLLRHKETHVGMGGGDVGIAGMDHQRHPQGLKGPARQFRPARRRRGGQVGTLDMGKVDAPALKEGALLQDTGPAPAALGPLPGIFLAAD